MVTRPGRKSAASRETPAAVRLNARPKPPDHLTEDEAAIWLDLTASMEAGYFTKGDRDTLANACRHLSSVRELSGWLRRAMKDEDTEVGDVEQLLRMRQRESASANACLRALRMTKQSQMHQRTAARASAGHLWDGGDEPRKPWERAE